MLTIKELAEALNKAMQTNPDAEVAFLGIDGLTHIHLTQDVVLMECDEHTHDDGTKHEAGQLVIFYYTLCDHSEFEVTPGQNRN